MFSKVHSLVTHLDKSALIALLYFTLSSVGTAYALVLLGRVLVYLKTNGLTFWEIHLELDLVRRLIPLSYLSVKYKATVSCLLA